MNRLRTTLLAALAALAGGCATLGAPPPGEVLVPSRYGHGDSELNRPATPLVPGDAIPSGTWWTQFGDPRLDTLVAQVWASNRDLVVAGLRLRQARARTGLAETALWPGLDASVNSSTSRPLDGDGESRTSHGASVSVRYELDLWGRLRAQADVAAWEAQATAEDLDATALALVGEAIDLYWTLAFLNQRIDAGTENLARLERTLELVRVQYEAGAVSGIELQEARQNLLGQRAAQGALEQQRVEVRNALAILLDGQPWPEAQEPRDLSEARSPSIAAGIPAELLARRPDLRAAEWRLRQARAEVGIARTSYYPAITLTGSIGGSSTSLLEVLANPVATLGAGLALPFLQWRQMQLDTELARLQYEIAINEFRMALHTAFAEVDTALSAKLQLAAEVELARQSFEAAAEIERMYEVRYRAGAASLRTWLDAQQTLRNAEVAFAEARLAQLRNDVALFQALGGTDRPATKNPARAGFPELRRR